MPTGFDNSKNPGGTLLDNVASNVSGIVSTRPNAKFLSGARCTLKINNQLVGFAFARLSHDVILASTKGIDPQTSSAIASITKWAISVFVILAVLSQLGVATDLIRILFTGLVAMLAIAGGIAFGLGGQTAAKDVIGEIKKKLI